MTAGGQELITRVQSGDVDAFTALVERYQPLVYRWSIGLVLDRDEADDVMQEAFVLAYRKLGSFRGEGSIEGWFVQDYPGAWPQSTVEREIGERYLEHCLRRVRRARFTSPTLAPASIVSVRWC